MIQPMESINIRVGRMEDLPAIIEFALALSEDAISSRDKWLQIIEDETIYPLIAKYDQNIVGKIQAKIEGNIGWLQATRVSPDFRKMGLAHTLVDAAMDWLIAKGVKQIRTVVDSDNMAARKIVERHHFVPKTLSINPSTRVVEDDADASNTADFANVLDEELFQYFYDKFGSSMGGNIMVDGLYLPFDNELFNWLIEDRRVYTNATQSILLIISKHNLPSEVHGLLFASTDDDYALGAKAIKAFAAREMATLAICHSPSQREAVIGLAREEFGWGQPHTLILYARESWQERDEETE